MSVRLHLGAEAEIVAEDFLGRPAVAKRRLAKTYRHPELDARIRRERTRLEAALLSEARLAGIDVPALFDVDVDAATLRVELVGGASLRELLRLDRDGVLWARRFGEALGGLHGAGLVHGDPTTSNAHGDGARLVLLDFGLAGRSDDVEDFGVDLHLVERTFEASHPGRPELFAAFLEGYHARHAKAAHVVRRMEDIKGRARYA